MRKLSRKLNDIPIISGILDTVKRLIAYRQTSGDNDQSSKRKQDEGTELCNENRFADSSDSFHPAIFFKGYRIVYVVSYV